MVAGVLYVIGHLIFKGEHSLGVHKPGACDEVFLVGVLPGQLVANQVAAVIEVLAVHPAILCRVPAAGFHLADLPPGLGGHDLLADVGVSHPAAAQVV